MRTKTVLIGVLFLSTMVARGQDLAVARAAAHIDTAIPWISDGFYPTDPGQPVSRLPSTGVDRGRLLDEALKRSADEQKLVFWYIPRIEGGHMVRPEILDGYMRVVAFTDEWLTKLINARFVPLRMAVDGPIAGRTGIKRLDWVEPAIVILDKDGRMLHRLDRIRTFNPDDFRQLLLRVTEAHVGATAPPGVWVELLQERETNSDVLRARICRSNRDAAGALAALVRAKELAGDHPSIQAAILTEHGLLALNTGDIVHAQAMLADAAGMRDNPRRAEAMYWLGIARILNRDTNGAEEIFRALVAEFGEDPGQGSYAAQAASNLMRARDSTPLGPAFHSFVDPIWPRDEVFAESRSSTACSRPVQQIDDTVRRAVAFLLRHQGGSGGFEDSRYAFCDSPRILPNVWVAITAIALSGLNDWHEVDATAIDEALARGEEYLFDPANLARGRNEECYADSFRLIYLGRRLARLPAGSEVAVVARRRMNDVAKRLIDQQGDDGSWAHEYPNPFATAAALHALKQAKDGGAAVPDKVFERGVSAVKSVRGKGGTFGYGQGRAPRRETDEGFKNAMARMPICERAILLATKDEDVGPLEASLDNFAKFLPRIERIRTCDFHSDGELGGFFFWHGVFLTSEAIKALPPGKRTAHEQRLLQHVMSIGEIDGSFVDSHELGKSYGSGMALMVLRNCAGRRP